ncbi:hypothetical protein PUN28_016754 [Cardiocondyla obscurior]|uniref:Uncharacterized protein n=1 Tax=Cardiocondyla obscurior TaxID=286306 RepID=A0AAW2ENJ0_9HYME
MAELHIILFTIDGDDGRDFRKALGPPSITERSRRSSANPESCFLFFPPFPFFILFISRNAVQTLLHKLQFSMGLVNIFKKLKKIIKIIITQTTNKFSVFNIRQQSRLRARKERRATRHPRAKRKKKKNSGRNWHCRKENREK